MIGDACIVQLAFSAILHFVQGDVPSVQPFSFPREVTKGQTVTVICAVLSGSGPFTFRWTKDATTVLDHEPLTRLQTSEEFSLLNLRSVDRSKAGNYTCAVTSDEGSAEWTAELLVNEPPEWSIFPEDNASVVLGQNLRVDCKAVGIPEPTISWMKLHSGGTFLETNISSKNGSLFIENARLQDGGKYKCVASSGIGDDLKKIISVLIHLTPQFHEEYELLKVRSSHSAVLQCEVYGDGPLSVKWSKDYTSQSLETRNKIQMTPLPKGLLSELHIPRVSKQDAGVYVCSATNDFGEKEKTIKVIVLEPPAAPMEIVIKQVGADEVTIKWVAPYSGNSPVLRYILQYWVDTGAAPKLQELRIYSNKTTTVLASLRPGTPYVVRLVAENEFGQSNPSIPVKFFTAEERPSGYPTDIFVLPRDSHTLLVKWKAPPHDQRNGIILGYDLGYRGRHTSQQYEFLEVLIKASDGGSHEYALSILQASTEYEVSVRAFNGAGRGPLSIPVTARTENKEQLFSPDLWVESTSSTTIILRWSPTTQGDYSKLYFTLYYRSSEGGRWQEKAFPAIEKSFLLSGLVQNTQYEIFVKASNGATTSNPSAVLKVTTSDPSSSSRSQPESELVSPPSMFHTTTLVIALSIVISIVIIVCVVAAACVYIVRVRSSNMKPPTRPEELGSRRLSEQRSNSDMAHRLSGSHFRYVDVNPRPFLWCSTPAPPANDYPSPYATLPLKCTPLSKRWRNEVEDENSLAESDRSDVLAHPDNNDDS